MHRFYNPQCDCSLDIAKEFAEYHHVTNDGEIFQTSLMSALISGVYEGSTTVEQLLEHGDFGLGTFNQLDGSSLLLIRTFFSSNLMVQAIQQTCHKDPLLP
jgi:acetolactate decarboxylase